MPRWAKIGIGVDAVLMALLALVLMAAGGSSPSRQATSATFPPVVAVPGATVTMSTATSRTTVPVVASIPRATATTIATTASTAGPGVTPTFPPATTSGGGGGSGQGWPRRCVDPDDCSPLTAMTADPRLRTPTAAEVAAIVSDVAPPPGQHFDAMMISVSEATWGVLHVATGDGHSQDYVAIHIIHGGWTAVDSGYPSLGCDPAIPSDVVADLEYLATPCS